MIRKIYCDSRFRTPQSKSSTDFEIELSNSVVIPRKAIGWISDLHLPVAFYNVDTHNNVLYLTVSGSYNGTRETRVKAATLPPQNYSGETLAEEITIKLNESPPLTDLRFFARYAPSEGTIHLAYGLNAQFIYIYIYIRALRSRRLY